MKYAILSDAHGNKLYFNECIKKIDEMNIQHLIFLGDMFGYMPDGIHILRTLRSREAHILKGNHESMLLGESRLDTEKDRIYKLKEQRELLDKKDKLFLAGLKPEHEEKFINGKILFVHGAPFDHLNGYLYEDDREFLWNSREYSFIFMGHTHRPYVKQINKTTFVNVGSCGLPRDIGLAPGFCIFDNKKLTVEIIRLHMDAQILESNYYAEVNDKVLEVLRRR